MNSNNPFSLANKTIVVTGASSGIGQAIAIELSNLGATIIVIGRNKERLSLSKKQLSSSGSHLMICADLTQEEDLNKVGVEIKNLYSKIDGLIHSAGISSTILLKSINTAKINKHFEINVFAALNLTKILLDRKNNLIEKDASIVFISSVMENHGAVGKTLYGMTKGAIHAGVKSLSLELANKNIRVNSVSPGVIETPLSRASYYSNNPETLNKVKEMHPLGIGQTQDVAFAVAYLISNASRWVTGTNLVVDGGYTAR